MFASNNISLSNILQATSAIQNNQLYQNQLLLNNLSSSLQTFPLSFSPQAQIYPKFISTSIIQPQSIFSHPSLTSSPHIGLVPGSSLQNALLLKNQEKLANQALLFNSINQPTYNLAGPMNAMSSCLLQGRETSNFIPAKNFGENFSNSLGDQSTNIPSPLSENSSSTKSNDFEMNGNPSGNVDSKDLKIIKDSCKINNKIICKTPVSTVMKVKKVYSEEERQALIEELEIKVKALFKINLVDAKKIANTLKTNNMSVLESMKSIKKNTKFYRTYFVKKE